MNDDDSPARDETFWVDAQWWVLVTNDRPSLRLDHDTSCKSPGAHAIKAASTPFLHRRGPLFSAW